MSPDKLKDMKEKGGKAWTLRRNYYYPVESDGVKFKLNGVPLTVVKRLPYTTLYKVSKPLVPVEFAKKEVFDEKKATGKKKRKKRKKGKACTAIRGTSALSNGLNRLIL